MRAAQRRVNPRQAQQQRVDPRRFQQSVPRRQTKQQKLAEMLSKMEFRETPESVNLNQYKEDDKKRLERGEPVRKVFDHNNDNVNPNSNLPPIR